MARRLVAIMFTDIAGYTSLAQSDEAGALKLLQEQEKLVRPILEAHRGRKVKSIGDGLLIEFPDALDAVEGGVELQRRIHEHNAEEGARRLVLRVGIHLGDVQTRGTDILGDAVNIASRIEPLAEPGGICLSAQVYDQVHNKVAVPLEKLGPKALRGVRKPVDVYRVRLPWVISEISAKRPASRTIDVSEGVPKIAVLPFTNLSPSPDDAYFADAMTEELIGRISRVGRLRVIARTSAMHYKGSGMRARDIASELEVSALVEGSVRRAGDRIRLAVQLVDSATEEPLWTSQYDRDLRDLLGVQSEIAAKVAESIAHVVAPGSVRDPAVDPPVYTTYLRAKQLLNADTEETLREARDLFEEAIRKDPHVAAAHAGLARCWTLLVARGQESWETLSTKAEPSARRAIDIGPDLAEPHAALAQILSLLDRHSEAIGEAEVAIGIDPSHAISYLALGFSLGALGRVQESLVALRRGHELDPLDALTAVTLGGVATGAGEPEEGSAVFERIHALYPQNTPLLRSFALHWADRGDLDRAQSILEENLRRVPDDLTLLSGLAVVEALRGHRAKAELILQRGQAPGAKGWIPDTELEIRLALGDIDEAFRTLERDGLQHTWPLLLLSDPKYARLREHPGFGDFCKTVGIPAP